MRLTLMTLRYNIFARSVPTMCRHEVYRHQFRAMFVTNCHILRDQVLKYVPRLSKKQRRKRRRKGRGRGEVEKEVRGEEEEEEGGGGGGERGGGGGGDKGEDYHPVHCAECNTEVAVYDKDEVFHFFNVLASAA